MCRLAWLMLYAALLMPGFMQAMWYYFLSGRVLRSIVYGGQPRNRLDLYMPNKGSCKPKSVVIFVTGGAWVIGYKAWGTLFGWALSDRNVITASIDYRNFPQGTISDMVADVGAGIGWVINNIASYGGDPKKVLLVSQSAGAHLSCMALVQQAKLEAISGGERLEWSALDLRSFIGVSGGYDLASLVDHFDDRGLYRTIFLSIMEGLESLPLFSPEVLVTAPSFAPAISFLPPFTLYHGLADISMPYQASQTFADALQTAGAKVQLVLLPGKTHTDLIIQDLMRGGTDDLFEAVMEAVKEGDDDARLADAGTPPRPRMLPEFLIQLARFASPF